MQSRSVRRARHQQTGGREGFIVTWDVDSRNASQCSKVRRFVFGYTLNRGGRIYRYPGFVEADGVRYIGQSVLFVGPLALPTLLTFLRLEGIAHVVTSAWLGAIMPS